MSTVEAIRRATKSSTHDHDTSYHAFDPNDLFAEPLLTWYDRQSDARKMPWRKEVSIDERKTMSAKERSQLAYAVWVSETMCQQTRVETVIPYYEKWMKRYPTLAHLAKADVEDVRGLWSGLGYYSRATRLLTGAQKVVDEYEGLVPDDPKVLEKEIPGIGAYTAAAICSIAFGVQIAAVDGNLQRVISRVFAIHAPIAAKATLNALTDLAQSVIPSSRPGATNQAMMDLGYAICTPRNPKCSECPLSQRCLAYAEIRAIKSSKASSFFAPKSDDMEDVVATTRKKGKPCTLCTPFDPKACLGPSGEGVAHYPAKKIKKAIPEEETAVRIVEVQPSGTSAKADRLVLVVQRPEKGLLAGQFEFPAVDLPVDVDSTSETRVAAMRKRLIALLGRDEEVLKAKAVERPIVRHIFSHQIRHYIADAVIISLDAAPKVKEPRAKWIRRDKIDALHLGKAMKLMWADHVAGDVRKPGKKAAVKAAKAVKSSAKKRKVESEDDDGFVVSDDDEEVLQERTPKSKRKTPQQPSQVSVGEEMTAPSSTKRKRVIVVSDEEEA